MSAKKKANKAAYGGSPGMVCCASSGSREIAKCGCKNQEVKLHYPVILERNRDGTFWTWSDCCCHALHPETGVTKFSRTEKAAINFAKRYFGFRHNAELSDRHE